MLLKILISGEWYAVCFFKAVVEHRNKAVKSYCKRRNRT